MPPLSLRHAEQVTTLWHPTKNLPLTLGDLSPKSTTKAWWRCAEDHEWEAGVRRITEGQSCPYCSGRRPVPGINDLATTNPMIAEQWSSNNTTSPSDYFAKSSSKVLWQCEQGHEWETRIETRVKGSGCSVCSGLILVTSVNDLSTTHPNLAAEWHPTKNKELYPSQVTATYTRDIWWECSQGHEWLLNVNRRTRAGQDCGVCSGRIALTGETDLTTTHPEIASEWDNDKNVLTPQEVTSRYNKKVWWRSRECGHSWDDTVNERTNRNAQCPVCYNRRVLAGYNDLATTHPDLSAQWHPTKNKDLTPDQVVAGSKRQVWWKRNGECEHEWQASINSRVRGNNCPVCAGQLILVGFNDLATVYPDLASQWHPTLNNNMVPQELSSNSHTTVWWLCPKDNTHIWSTPVYARLGGKIGCPVCENKKALQGFNDLATVSPDLAAQWHPTKNLPLTPQEVTRGAEVMVWWECTDKGHEWQAFVYSRTTGNGCPKCWRGVSQGERELYDYLISILPTGVHIQTNKRSIIPSYELDLFVPELNIAIEFNGIYWHSEEAGKNKDYHYNKWLSCNKKGIQLIDVWEDDWIARKEVIKRMLAHKLGTTTQKKISARKTVVKEVPFVESQEFLNSNHIQGGVSGSYHVGLYAKDTDELVSLLVGKWTRNGSGVLDIVRFATSAHVRGGFTKLLSHCEKNYPVRSFITFSDNAVSDGKLYASTGFTAVRELPPDYSYVIQGKRKHKFGYRLERFRTDPLLKWEEGLSERELATLNGITRIWDSGKIKWEKTVAS